MTEKNLDFDTVIDRTHTNSLKYDFAVQRGKPKDVLPLWVADMDFQVSSYIQEALSDSVAHGIFGYSEADGSYFEAVAGWMGRHYGWNVEEPWLVKTPGIVFALAQAVRMCSRRTTSGRAALYQRRKASFSLSNLVIVCSRRLASSLAFASCSRRTTCADSLRRASVPATLS